MAGSLSTEVIQDLVQRSSDPEQLVLYLRLLRSNSLLFTKKPKEISDLVNHVNTSLGSSKHRNEGLCLLIALLQQSSSETFTAHALVWCRLLIQALQSHDGALTKSATCQALGLLLHYTVSFPELTREIAGTQISPLMSALLDQKHEGITSLLSCFLDLMQTLPGACGPYKMKIENVVVPHLTSKDQATAESACRCYAAIATIGGGGNQGIKHVEGWSLQMDKLLGSMTLTLDALYQDCESTVSVIEHRLRLQLDVVPVTEPERTFCLLTHWQGLTRAASVLLREKCKVPVKVPMDHLVSLVCRALAVTPDILKNSSTKEMKYLLTALPQIHQHALMLLESLCRCCCCHLVPLSGTMNQLLLQTLKWTSCQIREYGQENQYGEVREQAYRTLSTWLLVAKAATGIEHFATDIFSQIFQDVKVTEDTVKLNSSKSVKTYDAPPPTKKRKKGGLFTEIGQLSGQRKVNLYANQKVCVAALKAATQILISAGSLIRPRCHKELHELIVPLVLRIQSNQSQPLIPYSAAPCRRELYHLLQTMILAGHPEWPPPVQCVVRLMQRGQLDNDFTVSSYCQEAMLILENVLHPRVPSLAVPTPRVSIGPTQAEFTNRSQAGDVDSSFTSSHEPALLTSEPTRIFGKQQPKNAVSVTDTNDKTDDMRVSVERGDGVITGSGQTSSVVNGRDTDGAVSVKTSVKTREKDDDDDDGDDDGDAMETDECILSGAASETILHQKDENNSTDAEEETNGSGEEVAMETYGVKRTLGNVAMGISQCSPSKEKASTSSPTSPSGSIDGAENAKNKECAPVSDKDKIDSKNEGGSGVADPETKTDKEEKQSKMDDTDLMLQSFVDAGPDSE